MFLYIYIYMCVNHLDLVGELVFNVAYDRLTVDLPNQSHAAISTRFFPMAANGLSQKAVNEF